MLVEANGLKIYRLLPEEVERLLVAQYGKKLVAVNLARLEKQNQRRTKSVAYYQKNNK